MHMYLMDAHLLTAIRLMSTLHFRILIKALHEKYPKVHVYYRFDAVTSVKWLWARVWNFLALGNPTSSVSRRVVKLTVPCYYSVPLPLQERLSKTLLYS